MILFLILLPYDLSGKNHLKSHWTPVHPVFDRTVDSLEKGFISGSNNELRFKQGGRLYGLAKAHPGEAVFGWRAQFWDALLQLKNNHADSAFRLLEKALAAADSAGYTYDWIRVSHLQSVVHPDRPHLAYQHLRKAADYYKSIGDRLMLSNAYVDLGNLLTQLDDRSKALEYFLQAETLYLQTDNVVYLAKNQLNISNILYSMNQKKRADKILKQLLGNPACRKDTAFCIKTLLLLAGHDFPLHKKYLSEACELSAAFADKGLLMRCQAFMGSYYQETGQPDSALFYYRKTILNAGNQPEYLLTPVYKKMSDCYDALGIPDSSLSYLKKYVQLSDSLDRVNSLAEVHRIENRSSIEKYELELKQRKERADFQFAITVIVCSFVLCLACLTCYIFWKKHREAQIKRQLKNLENKELAIRLDHEALQNSYFRIELESRERQLASNSLLVIEKNRVLKALLEQVGKEKDDRHIEPGTAIRMIRNIKNHLGKTDEWEFFKIQFEKVHPAFFTRLKNACPSLTEGELRTCSYIRIGMENKHIAQMLSLQPDSIKKTRYRIRKKLDIETDDSLEDFLRKI